jgi:hypothetical protein
MLFIWMQHVPFGANQVPQKTHTHIVNNSVQVEFVIFMSFRKKEEKAG